MLRRQKGSHEQYDLDDQSLKEYSVCTICTQNIYEYTKMSTNIQMIFECTNAQNNSYTNVNILSIGGSST
jgi:cytidine deaminase